MGLLDNVLDKSLPQGSGLAKPLMLAFIAHRAACIRGPYAQAGADLGAEHEPGDRRRRWWVVGRIGWTAREAPTERSW
jgi:hypothetical protein